MKVAREVRTFHAPDTHGRDYLLPRQNSAFHGSTANYNGASDGILYLLLWKSCPNVAMYIELHQLLCRTDTNSTHTLRACERTSTLRAHSQDAENCDHISLLHTLRINLSYPCYD